MIQYFVSKYFRQPKTLLDPAGQTPNKFFKNNHLKAVRLQYPRTVWARSKGCEGLDPILRGRPGQLEYGWVRSDQQGLPSRPIRIQRLKQVPMLGLA